MAESTQRLPVSRFFAASEVPAQGCSVEVTATKAELGELARLSGAEKALSFEADLVLRKWRRNGVSVSGTVRARLIQICVVSLEEIETVVEEAVDARFLPAPSAHRRQDAALTEVEIDPEGEDPPELFEGREIDLGRLAVEHFLIGVDPYPRKPGLAFEPVGEEDADTPEETPQSPFAALSRLKPE